LHIVARASKFGRRHHPAHPQARAEDLAETATVGQPVAAARHPVAEREHAGRWRLVEVEFAIRIVLDHQRAGAQRNLQNAQAARLAQGRTAGIAEGRNQVDQLGAMFLDHALEHIHLHAVGIDRRTDDIGAVEPETLDRRQEGRGLHDHLVAGGNHRLADEVQRLLAAGGDDQPVGRNGGSLGPHETADACAQRLVTFGGAILQHRARVAGQHRIGRHPDALGVKQRRIGETTGKADDARLAQQLEQLTDCGGFDVLESGGELHGCINPKSLYCGNTGAARGIGQNAGAGPRA
jgi:hypothetical protein